MMNLNDILKAVEKRTVRGTLMKLSPTIRINPLSQQFQYEKYQSRFLVLKLQYCNHKILDTPFP